MIAKTRELGIISSKTTYPYLTKREQEVLQLTLKEYTSKEIGELLKISSRTVEVHRQNLIKKFKVKSLIGLVREAVMMKCKKEQSAFLVAKGSDFSPTITYFSQTNELEIKGKSLAIERPQLYRRLLNHILTSKLIDEKGIKFVLELTDIDVTSQRILYELLKRIEVLYKAGKSDAVLWKCSSEVPDMRDIANDFATMVDVPISIVAN